MSYGTVNNRFPDIEHGPKNFMSSSEEKRNIIIKIPKQGCINKEKTTYFCAES